MLNVIHLFDHVDVILRFHKHKQSSWSQDPSDVEMNDDWRRWEVNESIEIEVENGKFLGLKDLYASCTSSPGKDALDSAPIDSTQSADRVGTSWLLLRI